MELKRFKQLLETTMGNVKPLLSESEEPEGENSFDYEVIFEFSCGGDGYGFSGSFNNLTGLLDGIKELLKQ